METCTPDEQDLAKEQKLEEIRNKFKRTTDSMELEIDPGIFEIVVLLNALDFPTSQSCEGHLEESQKRKPTKAPWVEIYPEVPEEEKWFENEKLRSQIEKESLGYKKRILGYLQEFYQDRQISFDAMIGIKGIGYGFRLQSMGTEIMDLLPKEEQAEKQKLYREEMQKFTQFLKEKYLKGETENESGKTTGRTTD